MSTLYEITGQYLELYEMMESADELEMKVIEDTLDGMDGELEEKAETSDGLKHPPKGERNY